MRWEKLFADLEGLADDDALAERDALVNDLSLGERAATTWQQLTGGDAAFEVAGVGRVDGEIVSSNARVIHVLTARAHVLLNPESVMAVLSASQRAKKGSAVASRLGWPHVFRLLQGDQDRVQVFRSDGTVRAGIVVGAGADFVRLSDDAGNALMIPYAAVAAVSCPR